MWLDGGTTLPVQSCNCDSEGSQPPSPTHRDLQLEPERPAARRIGVAVELERGHVVCGTDAASNRQTLARLHIPDLILPRAGHVGNSPTARRMAVAVELERRDVVFSTDASC